MTNISLFDLVDKLLLEFGEDRFAEAHACKGLGVKKENQSLMRG